MIWAGPSPEIIRTQPAEAPRETEDASTLCFFTNPEAGISRNVNVSLPKGEATVEFDEKRTSSAHLKSAVQNAGYGAESTQTASRDQGKGCCGA